MKVLITGAAGMLGSAVVESLLSSSFGVFRLVRSHTQRSNLTNVNTLECDLRDQQHLRAVLGGLEIDAVIHCAAITDVAYCEEHPGVAHQVHLNATEELTRAFPHARFLYISTDAVFDGREGKYSEVSIPNPLNTYARTKLEGENAALRLSDSVVIRTNLYDIRRSGGRSLSEWAYQNLIAGQAISGFSQVYFNPLHVSQIASIIQLLLGEYRSVRGIIHLGSDVDLSKYAFLREICRYLNFSNELLSRSELPSFRDKIQRPLNTTLDIELAGALFPAETLSFTHGFQTLVRKVAGFDEHAATH